MVREEEEEKDKVVRCEECKKGAAKYKCPCCCLQTCSLPCVRAHKERTSCSGKRDRTSFIPIASFNDDHLLSDYNLLEEVLRQSESAKRFRSPFNSIRKDPVGHWGALRYQAKTRNITLLFLPRGMTKRVDNSSRYCKRRRCILWRVEWKFHGTDLRLINAGADENESPAMILEKQLNYAGGFKEESLRKIRAICKKPFKSMRFLMTKEMSPGGQRSFVELDPVEPLGAQLDSLVVIEYPTILVVSPDDNTKFTIVEDRREVAKSGTMAFGNAVAAAQVEGVPYREEEIEEGEIVD